MLKIKVLYSFISDELDVLEIMILGLPESTPLSDIYKWLVVHKKNQKVYELDFKAMDKFDGQEFRTFVEGELKFNHDTAHLKLLGKEYHFVVEAVAEVCDTKIKLVKSYLSQEKSHFTNYEFRDLKPSDVIYFKKWIFDEEVIRFSMTKYHRISNESQIIDWFHSTLFDPRTFQHALLDPTTKNLIGYAGIAALNEVDRNGEYFIFIGNKSFWGKGIASSVTKEFVRLGFQKLNLHRIFLTASSKNPGAIRAYEKAGFTHEGRMREAFYRNKEFSDKVFMGILKSEYTSALSGLE